MALGAVVDGDHDRADFRPHHRRLDHGQFLLALAVLHQPAGGRFLGHRRVWSILRHRESKIVKLPIDVVGLVLLVIGVGSLQFMLDNGNEKDWFNSPVILAAAVTSRSSPSRS